MWQPASPKNYTLANRPSDIPIQRLIIHVAQGNFKGTYQWFKNPAAESSAHYVVGSSGEVAQMVPEADIAWHAGNWDYNDELDRHRARRLHQQHDLPRHAVPRRRPGWPATSPTST